MASTGRGADSLGGSHRTIRASGKPHSCAECRRLKLRCDRVFPCESCRKRNVAALCPNGSLPPRPRLLAEDAVKLSKTIAELTNRCRQLEDALRTLHSKYSTSSHPLLEPNLLTSSRGSDAHQTSATNDSNLYDPEPDELEAIEESLGTLTIDSLGNSNFLGRTAGMHMLLQSDDPEITDLLPPEIENFAAEAQGSRVIFSSLSQRKSIVMEHLRRYLPERDRAWSLCEIYFEHAAWLCHPIKRDYFINEIFGPLYNGRPSPAGDRAQTSRPADSHELALLFMVFSLATLLDLTLPPNNVEAEFYHQMARASLSCDPFLVEPTIPAIQSLLLMSYYHWLGNRKHNEQISWGVMGLIVNLCQNIGLHRDSAAWQLLDEKTMERQRLLFWELYAMELTQALNFGRPPSLSLSTVDCKMPADSTQFAFQNDDINPPFHSTKYRYFSVYLAPVIDFILGTKSTSYATALALDRSIRDQDVAPLIEFDASRAPGDPIIDLHGSSLGVTMQKFMLVGWPHLTLMYLHRGYFVRALSDLQPGQDLLDGRYAPSVLAIFRSSCVIIAMLQALERVNGELAKRFWLYWCHGLAAAIVVGSIVTKAPSCPLAQPALEQINAAYTLFERAVPQHSTKIDRPEKALAVVMRLRYRAHQAAQKYAGKHSHAVPAAEVGVGANDEELNILAGRTRIVADKPTHGTPPSNSTRSPASTGSPEGIFHRSPKASHGAQRGFTPETLDKAHPSLLEDLRTTKEQEQPHISQSIELMSPHVLDTTAFGPRRHSVPSQDITQQHPLSSHLHSQQPLPPPPLPPLVPPQWGVSPHTPTFPTPTGYVPALSDTQIAFGLHGGDPGWDLQWHSFMDQLGMFSSDPAAPYVSSQMKTDTL